MPASAGQAIYRGMATPPVPTPKPPSRKPAIERFLELWLFRSRWLMAPFYVGLVVALATLLWVFGLVEPSLASVLVHTTNERLRRRCLPDVPPTNEMHVELNQFRVTTTFGGRHYKIHL